MKVSLKIRFYKHYIKKNKWQLTLREKNEKDEREKKGQWRAFRIWRLGF